MAWVLLLVAGVLEVAWAIGLKHAQGLERPLVLAATLAAMAASIVLLGLAMRTLPVGTAYAVWVGIGAVGTAIAAVFLFGEPVNVTRVLGVLLILAGIVALKFA